jgi:putative ABC transport system ATP-binding protein
MIRTHQLLMTWPNGQTLSFPNIDLPQPCTLCLRGPSGSGKSTWLALVAGLLSPTSGDLVVLGQQPQQLTQAQRDAWRARHIGFMPQAAYLSNALNVQQNLDLVAFASGLAPSASHQQHLLQSLHIDTLLQHQVANLSQGQRLRVVLARALLQEPKLLLVDEPTANLDDKLAHSTLELLIGQTQEHGCGLVVATHDPRAIEFLQDKAQTLWLETQP